MRFWCTQIHADLCSWDTSRKGMAIPFLSKGLPTELFSQELFCRIKSIPILQSYCFGFRGIWSDHYRKLPFPVLVSMICSTSGDLCELSSFWAAVDENFHAQYDWTTGVTDKWKPMEEVPCRTSLAPLASPCFCFDWSGVETEGLLDHQRSAGSISIVRWNLRPSYSVLKLTTPNFFTSNFTCLNSRLFSGESNRPLTPILRKSIAIHLPFLSRYFCKSMPFSFSRTLKSTQIRGVPKSDFSGVNQKGDKGGGEEGRSGGKVNMAWRGKRGGKWGKKGGRKGARKHTRKTLILVPLWFRYSLVAFQLLAEYSIYTTNLYHDTAPICITILLQKY